MNLSSGTKIGRYEIRSLLGAGGMGEVYRAFDVQLEREVAVKILKHADDAEKLRRFRQEAKAVSALNHPNILTIYEVGEYKKSHYIVSELVAGKNLRQIMGDKKLSPGEILDIAIQIGNALAAAHHVGIVHRDIKPENIMITPDEYVKVLDFGLAKIVFTDGGGAAAHDSEAETASLIQTRAGMLLGTVNYMSPEQLRGKAVDGRTDVWSLGICLFEMFTASRPFTGETTSDVIAAVLERALPPPAELDAIIPAEIERVIAKSLEKKAENRFQSAKEFVAALKEAKATWISGSFVAFNKRAAARSTSAAQKTLFTDRVFSADGENLSGLFIAGARVRWSVVAVGALLAAAMLALGGWIYLSRKFAAPNAAAQKKVARLTTTGNIINGALSPDGRWVVFARSDSDGRQSLLLRPTDETTVKELIPPSADAYTQLVFAPDGDWIYYTVFSSNGVGRLNRIKKFGSSQQEVSRDVDSTISFAPDGKSFAFIRGKPLAGVDQIVVADLNGGERVLSEKRQPEFYTISTRESLAWSPDGKFIAAPTGKIGADGEFMSVAEINAETGAERLLTDARWYRVGRVLWTRDADELLITAADAGAPDLFQIRKISRGNGRVANVTSELNDFYNLSLSADSTRLLGVACDRAASIYTASMQEPTRPQQIAGGSYDGIGGAAWTADASIVYTSMESGNRDIWMMESSGANRRQLTFDKAADDAPAASPDGRYIVFVSTRGGTPHIWRMNPAGGELKQLTDRGGGESAPVITPDGNWVVYSSRIEGRPRLWKVSIEGGAPAAFTDELSNGAAVSPDGKRFAYLARGTSVDAPTQLAVASFETGAALKFFRPAGVISVPDLPTLIRWQTDNRTIAYAAGTNGVSNIWTQNVEGGDAAPLTNFTTDKIFAFDFSKDGARLLYTRGGVRNDLVLIENF